MARSTNTTKRRGRGRPRKQEVETNTDAVVDDGMDPIRESIHLTRQAVRSDLLDERDAKMLKVHWRHDPSPSSDVLTDVCLILDNVQKSLEHLIPSAWMRARFEQWLKSYGQNAPEGATGAYRMEWNVMDDIIHVTAASRVNGIMPAEWHNT